MCECVQLYIYNVPTCIHIYIYYNYKILYIYISNNCYSQKAGGTQYYILHINIYIYINIYQPIVIHTRREALSLAARSHADGHRRN